MMTISVRCRAFPAQLVHELIMHSKLHSSAVPHLQALSQHGMRTLSMSAWQIMWCMCMPAEYC